MYVGIDYHKRYAVATSMDDKGQVVETVRLKNEPGDLIGFVDRLPEDSKIAIEATGNWYYFYELLEGKSPEIHLAHPLKTRAIAEARIKTDKIDSTILAHLLRTDLLPESYIPPRDIREVLRYRALLVSLRSALKNRIHAILSKNSIIVEYTDNLGKRRQNAAQSAGSPELLPAGNRRIYQVDRDAAAAHRRGDQGHRGDRREQSPGQTTHNDPRHRLLLSALDRERDRGYHPIPKCQEALFVCRLGTIGLLLRWKDTTRQYHQARLKMASLDTDRAVPALFQELQSARTPVRFHDHASNPPDFLCLRLSP